jgi:hypothetical protein
VAATPDRSRAARVIAVCRSFCLHGPLHAPQICFELFRDFGFAAPPRLGQLG